MKSARIIRKLPKTLWQCCKCKTMVICNGKPPGICNECGGDWIKVGELK